MKIKNMLIFCMAWILAGCSPAGVNTPPTGSAVEPPVVDSIPLPSATTQPTHTATPSPTVYVSPTATPTPTATQPITSGNEIMIETIELLEQPLAERMPQGVLVLRDVANNMSGKYYLQNLDSGEIQWISQDVETACWTVSPRHDRLACESDSELIIVDQSGSELTSIPWKGRWYKFLDWLDNERVILINMAPTSLNNTIIYDIISRKEIDLSANYPDLNSVEVFKNIGYAQYTAVIYSPALDFVVYDTYDPVNYEGGIQLWDISNQVVISRLPHGIEFQPIWSSEGDRVLVAGKGISPDDLPMGDPGPMEIFVLDTSGKITQLTHLGEQFPYSKLFDVSWSPDETMIAFHLKTDGEPCQRFCILVYDFRTNLVKGYQFPIGYRSTAPPGPVYKFTWSPDSRYILLQVVKGNGYDNKELMMFDVEQGVAFPVTKEVAIIGWMLGK